MRIKLSEYIAANLIFGGFFISSDQYDLSSHLSDEEKNKLRYTAEQLNISYFQLIYEYEVRLIDFALEEYWKDGFSKGLVIIPQKSGLIEFKLGIGDMCGDIKVWEQAMQEHRKFFNTEDFTVYAGFEWPKVTKNGKKPIDDFHKEQRKQHNAFVNKHSAKQYRHGNYRGKVNKNHGKQRIKSK
jgi:hypothetical protein